MSVFDSVLTCDINHLLLLALTKTLFTVDHSTVLFALIELVH